MRGSDVAGSASERAQSWQRCLDRRVVTGRRSRTSSSRRSGAAALICHRDVPQRLIGELRIRVSVARNFDPETVARLEEICVVFREAVTPSIWQLVVVVPKARSRGTPGLDRLDPSIDHRTGLPVARGQQHDAPDRDQNSSHHLAPTTSFWSTAPTTQSTRLGAHGQIRRLTRSARPPIPTPDSFVAVVATRPLGRSGALPAATSRDGRQLTAASASLSVNAPS